MKSQKKQETQKDKRKRDQVKQLGLKQHSEKTQIVQNRTQIQEQTAIQNFDEDQALKNQTFVEYTGNQQKIWRLFKSLDCSQCKKMYNNKQRKPFIICANNHLLCKSCYSKIRQLSFHCPYCNVRMSSKNTSSNESIQLFLRIYNEIFEKQKQMIEEKRKNNYLDFEIPKNIKTLFVLLLIIVTPWIFDALKFVVSFLIDLEYRLLTFLYDQVSEILSVMKIIIEDQFYINLYTNQNGKYVYYGDDIFAKAFNANQDQNNFTQNNSFSNIYTPKHRAKIEAYLKVIMILNYLSMKIGKIMRGFLFMLRISNYLAHFSVILIGIIQFPFLIPIILVRLQFLIPRRYRYRIGLYLDLIQPEEQNQINCYIEPQDIQHLSKSELYFFLVIRNYIQGVLRLYKSIELDMRKRCQELEYKKKMRLMKKTQKQTISAVKAGKNSSSATSRMKFTF